MTHSIWSRRRLLQALSIPALGLGLGSAIERPRVARAAPAGPIRRLVFVTWSNGVQGLGASQANAGRVHPGHGTSNRFWPASGRALPSVLPPVLEPLDAIRENCCVVQGLANLAAQAAKLSGHEAYLTLLSGTRPSQNGFAGGPSFDQTVAAAFAANTLYSSVQMGVYAWSRRAVDTLVWRDVDAPLFAENDPAKIFTAAFGGASRADTIALWSANRSILDESVAETTSIANALSASDRTTFDDHLSAIRELEHQFDPSRLPDTSKCGVPPAPADLGSQADAASFGKMYPRIAASQIALLPFLLSCDVTRVATLQFGDSHMDGYQLGPDNELIYDGANVPLAETADIHLNIAHDGEGGHKDAKTAYDRWHVSQFANLVTALSKTDDPVAGGKLLDSTVVVLMNSFANGSTHWVDPVPVVVASKLLGASAKGTCLDAGKGNAQTPSLNQLYLALAELLGLDLPTVGSAEFGTAPIGGLL
jgi:hypothetical protein